MEFFVYSRHAIETLPPHDVPHVVISITTTAEDVARIPQNEHCRGVLRLWFRDVDQVSEQHPEETLFRPEHAKRIWELVRAHRAEIERVLVHCDAGMCRSPAVAAAIARALGEDDEPFFRRYMPNRRVYRMLLAEHEADEALAR